MADFRGIPDNFSSTTRSIQTEPLIQKQISTPKETSLITHIRTIVKQSLQEVGTFFQKLAKNSSCEDHSVGMRHSMGKVSKLAPSFFKKLTDQFKKGFKAAFDNRIVRKLKDVLDFLEKCDFSFVRRQKDPFLQEKFDNAVKNILERYRQFEKKQQNMTVKEIVDEIIALLLAIAKVNFKPNQYTIRNAMVGELLTKHIVSQQLVEGMEFPLPCFNLENLPVVVNYKLFNELTLGNTGIPVYIFQPREHKDQALFSPLLVFRGTRFSFSCKSDIRSIIENLNKVGPARGIYDNFKKDLDKIFYSWFKVESANQPKFRILGYSQGAVLGQRAIVDYHQYLEKGVLNASILFNSPGVEIDYVMAWNNIPLDQRPVCVNILVTQDIVSKRGTKFIGDVYEVQPFEKSSMLHAHLGAKFIAPELEIYYVDNDKEADSETRKLVNEVMSSSVVEGLYTMASSGLNKLQSQKNEPITQAKTFNSNN